MGFLPADIPMPMFCFWAIPSGTFGRVTSEQIHARFDS